MADDIKDEAEVIESKPLTNQELYSKVRKHLLTQMQKSLGPKGACVYRGKNGLMCGIGVLIPNALYTEAMEGRMVAIRSIQGSEVFKVNNTLVFKAANLHRDQLPLANDLQRVHDASQPFEWEYRLNSIASSYHLEA